MPLPLFEIYGSGNLPMSTSVCGLKGAPCSSFVRAPLGMESVGRCLINTSPYSWIWFTYIYLVAMCLVRGLYAAAWLRDEVALKLS